MTAHRYRQRPIEAIQYRPDVPNCQDIARFLDYLHPASFCDDEPHDDPWEITSAMTAYPGDWIIRDAQGEFCLMKPDIFTATYEPVDDEDRE